MKYPLLTAAGLAALGTTFLAMESPAQDGRGADADQGRRCVSLREIDRTSIVDNHTVLFFMKNGSVYENRLERACPDLDRRATVSYRVVLDQLCDGDTINVLQQHGFGYIQTGACPVGPFRPIEEDAAKDLLSRPER